MSDGEHVLERLCLSVACGFCLMRFAAMVLGERGLQICLSFVLGAAAG